MKDRNDHYVPDGLNLPAPWHAEVGRPKNGHKELREKFIDILNMGEFGNVGEIADRLVYETMREMNRMPGGPIVDLTWGLPDELNRDRHGSWKWADVSGDGTHWSQFQGHIRQIDVEMHTYNEREVNDWKGRDEIRKSGYWKLYLDRICVFSGSMHDPMEAFLVIRRKIQELEALPFVRGGFDWRNADIELIGRRIYYRDQPAHIKSLILDQGCIMIAANTEDGKFRQTAYAMDEDETADLDESSVVKTYITDPNIWWWRQKVDE